MERFPWGRIIEEVTIGSRYRIVVYAERRTERTLYHAYADGKDTHQSNFTLEASILMAIARAHLGVNEAPLMALAATRILRCEEPQDAGKATP